MASVPLLQTLLARGDSVAIENGRLMLMPASGNPVPHGWLKENAPTLIEQIAVQTGIPIFRYTEYSIGRYDKQLYSGVTLQFDCITTRADAYAIFNCILNKARSTKHGAASKPLPNKHFRLNRKHQLTKLLQRSGIKPRHPSEAHKAMHKLKELVFTGSYRKGSKLDNESITPLNLTPPQLLELLKATGYDGGKDGVRRGYDGGKDGVRNGDKDLRESVTKCGFQPFSTTGVFNYGYKNNVTREHGKRVSSSPSSNPKVRTVQNQSHEDWLREYEDSEQQGR
jgi:hypothetical protein